VNSAAVDGLILERDFVPRPAELFAWLVDHIAWDYRMKARLTASCGRPYDYAGISYDEAPMPPPLVDVCDRLEVRLGFRPNNCLLNYYLDGGSKMGFHADSIDELEGDTGVAIVSLGAERPLRFRRQGDITVRSEIVQPSGSMLYLPQQVHREWVHAIPRVKQAGPRISLTFRRLK
jgi:alkylated DNA repair dioxygenase AlkB